MALRTPLSVTPHLYMGDSTGRPLDNGVVYFGEQDKDPEFYPIELFSDDALTLPLAQPVHTKGGYLYDKGDMVEPHAKEIIYSVKVLDSYGRKVFYKGAMMRNSWNDDVIQQINAAIVASTDIARQIATDITNDAINNTAVEGGVLADTFVTVTSNSTGSIPRTQRDKNHEQVSVKDFGAVGDGIADDSESIQKALNHIADTGETLTFPKGQYLVSVALLIKGEVTNIVGNGGVLLLSTLNSKLGTANKKSQVSIRGLILDGARYGTYAEHYDEPYGIDALTIQADIVNIEGNHFRNIYGTGIQVVGTCNIVSNTFYDVAGYNPTTDVGGQNDNYGDAIRVSGANSKGGSVVNNYMVTSNKGRAGIVVEFNPEAINVSGNYISGYNQSIHLELCKTTTLIGNYCENSTTALLVSSGRAIAIGNYFKSGGIPPSSYDQGTVNIYSNGGGSILQGNTIVAGSSAAITVRNSDSDNVVVDSNEITGASVFNETPNFKFTGNKVSAGYLSCIGVITTGYISNNEFIDSYLSFGGGSSNITAESNLFRPKTQSSIRLSNINGGVNILNNRIIPDPEAQPADFILISSYEGTNTRGDNKFGGNIVETDKDFTLFTYGGVARHQPFRVDMVNYKLSSTGVRTRYIFSTAYDNSGARGEVFFHSSAPSTGAYTKGDISYNTNPSIGQPVGWVCTVTGNPATWAGFGVITDP